MEVSTEEIYLTYFPAIFLARELLDTIGRNTLRELNIYEKFYHNLLIGTQKKKQSD